LGVGQSTSRTNPAQVVGGNLYQSISAGYNHTCGVTNGGQLFCWGANSSGQLGTGNFTAALSPIAVTGVAGLVFVQVAAGGFQTCARTNTGALYCWGNNDYGQMGDGSTTVRPTPILVNVGGPISSVSAGVFHTCALRTTGAAFCWGFGGLGELGDGNFQNRSVPTAVAGGFSFATLVSGRQATCGITTAGSAMCWGGIENITGTGTSVNRSLPTVPVSGSNFTAIAPNMNFVCGVATGGAGRCWGVNTLGELGIGVSGVVLAPAPVQANVLFMPPSERITRRR
jgi:alpha-tubulin suppressor-like RCC1 family protein